LLGVKLVIFDDDGREIADRLRLFDLDLRAQDAGWDLRPNPDLPLADFVIFSSELDGGIHKYPDGFPEGGPRYFWVIELDQTQPEDDGKGPQFDWDSNPYPSNAPHDHRWPGQSYSAEQIHEFTLAWLHAVRVSRSLQIFVSYAREDRSCAREVAETLTENGHAVWVDHDALLVGQDWDLEIRLSERPMPS
jgi:hypothetical protein